jgi:hypothetical protein
VAGTYLGPSLWLTENIVNLVIIIPAVTAAATLVAAVVVVQAERQL